MTDDHIRRESYGGLEITSVFDESLPFVAFPVDRALRDKRFGCPRIDRNIGQAAQLQQFDTIRLRRVVSP